VTECNTTKADIASVVFVDTVLAAILHWRQCEVDPERHHLTLPGS